MWIAIALIATFLLSMAFMPKTKREEIRATTIEDLDFPRASFGDAIPMVWGTVKQKSPVLLWFGGFEVGPVSQDGVTTGFKHYLGMDLAICLGPNVRLREIWSDDQQVWVGSSVNEIVTIDLPALYGGETAGGGLVGEFSWWSGNFADSVNPQLQDSYLLGVGISPLPSYAGVAHFVVRGAYYGMQSTPKPYSFVITRIPNGLNPSKAQMPNGYDINPMEIVYDLITSEWGGIGMDPSVIDTASFIAASDRLYTEGLGMSLMVQNAVEAKTVLAECMKVADGILFQEPTTGKIKVKLIRSGESTSGILTLNESNIVGAPKNFKKTTWESTFNQVRVSFDDRGRFYNSSIAMAQDFGNVMGKTRIRSTSIDMPGVRDPGVAGQVANRHLALVCVPLYACEVQANRQAAGLRPGDLFKLSWKRYAITDMVMRVTKIDLGSLEDGVVTINCVQDRYATALNNMSSIGVDIDDGTRTDPDEVPVINSEFWIPPLRLLTGFYTNGSFNQQLLDECRTLGYYSPNVRKPLNIGESWFEGRLATRYKVWAGYTSGSVSQSLESGGSGGFFYKLQGRIIAEYDKSLGATNHVDTSETLIVEFPDREQNYTTTNPNERLISPVFTTGDVDANPLQARLANGVFRIGDEIMKGWLVEAIPGTKRIKIRKVWRALLDSMRVTHPINTRVCFELASGGPTPPMVPPVQHGSKLWVQVREFITPELYMGPTDTIELPTMVNRQCRPIRPDDFRINGSRTPSAVSTGSATPPSMTINTKARARSDAFLRLPEDDQVMEDVPYGYRTIFQSGEPVQLFWELSHVFEWEVSGANVATGKFVANALAGTFTLNWASIPGGSGILTNVGANTIHIKAYCAERLMFLNTSAGIYDQLPMSDWLFSMSYDECSIVVNRT